MKSNIFLAIIFISLLLVIGFYFINHLKDNKNKVSPASPQEYLIIDDLEQPKISK